jgi:hypothetical protein
MLISGPLNTEGSFMSFQTWMSDVLFVHVKFPSVEGTVRKSPAHQAEAVGLKKSTQEEEPGQHQPSYSELSLVRTSRPLSEAS